MRDGDVWPPQLSLANMRGRVNPVTPISFYARTLPAFEEPRHGLLRRHFDLYLHVRGARLDGAVEGGRYSRRTEWWQRSAVSNRPCRRRSVRCAVVDIGIAEHRLDPQFLGLIPTMSKGRGRRACRRARRFRQDAQNPEEQGLRVRPRSTQDHIRPQRPSPAREPRMPACWRTLIVSIPHRPKTSSFGCGEVSHVGLGCIPRERGQCRHPADRAGPHDDADPPA